MTTQEQDVLVGRVIRESKEAEAELQRLLVKAQKVASDMDALRVEVCRRIDRARAAGKEIYGSSQRARDVGFEINSLELYAESLSIEALRGLDDQITRAVARAIQLREQKAQLGI